MLVWKNNIEGKPNNLKAVARSYSIERAKSKATDITKIKLTKKTKEQKWDILTIGISTTTSLS